MKSLFFTQSKPATVNILAGFILMLACFRLYDNTGNLNQFLVLFAISILLFGYSISFEITKQFKNKRHFKLFGITIFKTNLNCFQPEYITVFSAAFKQGAEWGSVAAMGKERSGNSFVIRFFKGNKHFTVYKTNSVQEAKDKATRLSELTGIKLYLK